MMLKIGMRVTGHRCTPRVIDLGTEGSYGAVQLSFRFDSDWDGMSKTVHWETDNGVQHVPVGADDTAEVQQNAFTAGRWRFSVSGENENARITTEECTCKVRRTVGPA